jgi:hypothetical protein
MSEARIAILTVLLQSWGEAIQRLGSISTVSSAPIVLECALDNQLRYALSP